MKGGRSDRWLTPNGRALSNRACAGAGPLMEPADMLYGARNAGVKDRNGNVWWIATQIEDLASEEILRRGENPENWRGG